MKNIFISTISLAIILSAFSPIECSAEKQNKSTFDLVKPPEPETKSTDDLKEFDITTQKTRLDPVRSTQTLEENEALGFKIPPSKGGSLLQDKGLQIVPKDLDRLLYPRSAEKEEDKDLSSKKARLKSKLSTGQQEDLSSFKMKQNQAMVQDLGNGTFEVDQDFERQVPTLLDMNKLAYAIGKRGTVEGEYDARAAPWLWPLTTILTFDFFLSLILSIKRFMAF